MAKVSRPGYPMETRATVLDPLRWIVKFRPRLRSQTTTSMMAPTTRGGAHHRAGRRGALGGLKGLSRLPGDAT
jgi:hypothetical protein